MCPNCLKQAVSGAGWPPGRDDPSGWATERPLADISCSLPPLFVPAVPAVWAQGPAFTGTSPVAPLRPRGGGQAFCWAFERGVCVRVQRVSLALARAGELECSAHVRFRTDRARLSPGAASSSNIQNK